MKTHQSCRFAAHISNYVIPCVSILDWVAPELLHLGPQVNIYIYIYIYGERERERLQEGPHLEKLDEYTICYLLFGGPNISFNVSIHIYIERERDIH